jgi:hypothetical protein
MKEVGRIIAQHMEPDVCLVGYLVGEPSNFHCVCVCVRDREREVEGSGRRDGPFMVATLVLHN